MNSSSASSKLSPAVYNQLRAIAHDYLVRFMNGPSQTLQPTALVHEAVIKLLNQDDASFTSENHFRAVAAVAMRHIIIDHLRTRQRAKRGGGWGRITLCDNFFVSDSGEVDLLALDEALNRLAELDERAAKVVELRFFGGLTEPAISTVLGVSERTVRNDWRMAKAWLRCALSDATNPGDASESSTTTPG